MGNRWAKLSLQSWPFISGFCSFCYAFACTYKVSCSRVCVRYKELHLRIERVKGSVVGRACVCVYVVIGLLCIHSEGMHNKGNISTKGRRTKLLRAYLIDDRQFFCLYREKVCHEYFFLHTILITVMVWETCCYLKSK